MLEVDYAMLATSLNPKSHKRIDATPQDQEATTCKPPAGKPSRFRLSCVQVWGLSFIFVHTIFELENSNFQLCEPC